ncbi:MAG: PQQ-binding-like beta-propeller repeat protein [Prevotellaceae bacterium]|jgi:outer membrane protein assembly factor BamB|nr:PQQ-binding-like beta-propeller repeat protein [Prevotellaceae bacterium]
MNILNKLFLLSLSGLLIACSAPDDKSALQNWPLFRGNASLSGYTDTKLPDKPTLLWTYKSSSRTVSSPIVYSNTTYWCDKRGKIYGINPEGELVFEFNFETAVEATPMIFDSILYIGRIDGFMTAVSLVKKDTVWNFETMGQISASPNSINFEGRQAVVFGSYDNYLYSVDYENGKEINRYESGYYINGAVALWKDHVVFGGCDSWLRIINCTTGVPSDSLLLDAYVPASPAISGDYCYVADYSGNVYELFICEGKISQWKKIVNSAGENNSFVSVPAISETTLFILSDDRYLRAINRKDSSLRWKYLLKGNSGESSPVVCSDKVIVCAKTGIVSILDVENGELLWEFDAGEQIVASPAIVKDRFYILTAKGSLFCFGKS